MCFVSFNYDVLIEHACKATWNLNFHDLPSYCGKDPYAALAKPHGSALWHQRIKGAHR